MTKPYFTVAVIAHQPEPSLQKTLNSISAAVPISGSSISRLKKTMRSQAQ